MMESSALLCLQAASVSRGKVSILQNINFSINTGEIVTIVGPNGSGKTTMLRLLIGALQPTSGRVVKRPGLKLGYVPQKLHMERALPMTVERFFDLPRQSNRQRLSETIKQVKVGHLLDKQMMDLSGGQFQRVLLARALLNEPEILVLDEATQGLDQRGSAEFYQHIESVRQELGCAVLMVSHELHVVMSASDRVVCLNGHICCEGAPESVSSKPEYRALFGTGTRGTLALYRHDHDHDHDHDHGS